MQQGYILFAPGAGEADVETAVNVWKEWIDRSLAEDPDRENFVSMADQAYVADAIVKGLSDITHSGRTDSGYELFTVEGYDEEGRRLGHVVVIGDDEFGYAVQDAFFQYDNGMYCEQLNPDLER